MGRSVLTNISWLGFANVAVKPFWFLFITGGCMRVLGVEGYGVMNVALSVAALSSVFIDLGMARFTVREVARNTSTASRLLTNLMALRALLSLLALGIALTVGRALGYSGAGLAAVGFAALYTVSLDLTNYCRSYYEALERFRLEAFMLSVEKALVIGGGVLILLTTEAVHWTLAGMAAGMMLTTGVNLGLISRHVARFNPALMSWRFTASTVRAALPFGLAGLLTLLYFRVDMVMIEALLGNAEAGQYGVAFRILEALIMLPVVVSAALYPRLSALEYGDGKDDARDLLQRGLWGIGLFSTAMAICLTVAGPWIINLLDPDPAFIPAGAALQVLCWAFPLYCLNSVIYSALVAKGDEKVLAFALGTVLVFNVAANLFAIPLLGIRGAALTTVLSELLLLLVYTLRYRTVAARVPRVRAPLSRVGQPG